MSSGFDEYWDRKIRGEGSDIPPEFGGPVKGVSGKQYEQLEFDFGGRDNDPFDFLYKTDMQLEADQIKHHQDLWKLKNNVGNYVMQARAIIEVVMNDLGTGGRDHDNHEFALWGATELLQNAIDLLE